MNARLIQAIALVVMIAGTAVGGSVLPGLLEKSEQQGLRYSDVSVANAPPIVAVGTAIGALRGLIVDILWIKIHAMKQKGLFYEVMKDAELVTKLQPHSGEVWAFHGHNMAYNISVATHTMQERWAWVKAGIRLVQTDGMRYNPNDIRLYKNLAFWYQHKIEGYSDDAHLYYKNQHCREWHFLLGQPPESWPERIEWIREIADAYEAYDELAAAHPVVRDLVNELRAEFEVFAPNETFALDARISAWHTEWQAITRDSEFATLSGALESYRNSVPVGPVMDRLGNDPKYEEAWPLLLAHVRKRGLIDEYNMEPDVMLRYTEKYGPLDWRHGSAHSLYWAGLGAERGATRSSSVEDVYQMLNTDRHFLHSMQDLARWGKVYYDPFGPRDLPPTRIPDPRFIDTIEGLFDHFYAKYYNTRGAGGESFIGFLQNFLSSSVRQCFRAGETQRAQRMLDKLNELFGTGRTDNLANPRYAQPLEVFVAQEVAENYWSQPHLAPSECYASMRYAYRVGIGQDREEVYRDALTFVAQVRAIYTKNEYYDFVTKFGTGRMNQLLGQLDQVREAALYEVMVDRSVPMRERATIWSKFDAMTSKVDPTRLPLRALVYDQLAPQLDGQLRAHPLGQKYTLNDLFPPPPRMEEARAMIAQRRAAQQKAEEAARGDRGTIGATGSGAKLGGGG